MQYVQVSAPVGTRAYAMSPAWSECLLPRRGFLVPEGEQQTYEDRIVELMQDANRREAMGAEAMKHAQSFSRDRVAEKWFQVIG